MVKIMKVVGVGKSIYSNEKIDLERILSKDDSLIAIGVQLSLLLGVRESEVCGIRFADIDIKNKVIHIRHIVSRVKSFNTRNKTKLILSTPKTEKSKRELPIPDRIYLRLAELKQKFSNYDYLITGTPLYMDPRTFYNRYKKFLSELNLDYTYHDLRHTFATSCVELGIDYKSLMELLGHSNVTTTMNIYVHPTLKSKRQYINQL